MSAGAGDGRRGIRFDPLTQAAGAHLDFRAERAAVADASGQLRAYRVRAAAAVVAEEADLGWRSEQHIDVAVAVDIGGREGLRLEVRANHSRAAADVEPARAEIPEHSNTARCSRHEIEQAIVVVIDELRARLAPAV